MAYAQLVGQKFHPPKIWDHWNEVEGTKEWRWRDIGMKLVRIPIWPIRHYSRPIHQACGFEMLYQESKNRSDATSTSDATVWTIYAYRLVVVNNHYRMRHGKML